MFREDNHIGHMWQIGGIAVVAVLLSLGIGWALAFAMLGCGAMFVALLWLMRSASVSQRDATKARDPRDDLHHA